MGGSHNIIGWSWLVADRRKRKISLNDKGENKASIVLSFLTHIFKRGDNTAVDIIIISPISITSRGHENAPILLPETLIKTNQASTIKGRIPLQHQMD